MMSSDHPVIGHGAVLTAYWHSLRDSINSSASVSIITQLVTSSHHIHGGGDAISISSYQIRCPSNRFRVLIDSDLWQDLIFNNSPNDTAMVIMAITGYCCGMQSILPLPLLFSNSNHYNCPLCNVNRLAGWMSLRTCQKEREREREREFWASIPVRL